MDDVDRMLRSSLRERAETTPAPVDLLGAVQHRSRRLARRRRFAVGGAAAAVVAVTAAIAVLPGWGGGESLPPAGPGVVGPSAVSTVSPSPVTSPSTGATSSPEARPDGHASTPAGEGHELRLAAPAFTAPTFPWRPRTTPIGGLDDPEITLRQGRMVAYYAAKDPVRGADVTIRVGLARPTFPTAAGPVSESAQRVRGRAAVLRTVHVSPAARLSLYWREPSGRWNQVDTDDTLTDAEVVRFADDLVGASLPVPMPFDLALSPVGMVPDSISRSTVTFRPAAGGEVVTCALTEGIGRAQGRSVRVGGHSGRLTRSDIATVLAVALDDRGETLTVMVPARYPVGDADLIRLAKGITITEYAEP